VSEERFYWRSIDERDGGAADEAQPSGGAEEVSRRGFLKAAGFTAAGTALAACSRAPVEKAIPYLLKPEEVTPGRSLLYASTCAGCSAACGVLVKCRDGRPIKVEGNELHPLSQGGVCAVGQASLLSLYDGRRLRQPRREGSPASWEEVDLEVMAELAAIRSRGGAVRFLTSTPASPAAAAAIARFLAPFTDARHVVYDALSCSAILDAHELTHGARALPRYRFERAEVVASFDADFLGTWISPVEYTAGWRAGRDLDAQPPRSSYHVQVESRLSLTGSKADRRLVVAPHELGPALAHLAGAVARHAGVAPGDVPPLGGHLAAAIDELAERLWAARGGALVVCGSQDVDAQVACNVVNHLLGSYGSTLDLERPSRQKQGSDRALARLLDEVAGGQVALLVAGANPVYELPDGAVLGDLVRRLPFSASFATHLDETAECVRFVCPDDHPLETWRDAEPVAGIVSVGQPAIARLGGTRALVETLAAWSGAPATAYEIVRERWRREVFPRQRRESDFDAFWDRAVHDGVVEVEAERTAAAAPDSGVLRAAAPAPGTDGLALVLYPKVGMLAGEHGENAWLHELPDPVSKVTWDNYACLAPAAAQRLGVGEGDLVRVQVDGRAIELPAYVQPGQHEAVVAVALGYGRAGSARFAAVGPRWLEGRPSVGPAGVVGVNAAPLLALSGGTLRYERAAVSVTAIGGRRPLACTQAHHAITVPEHLAPAGGARRPVIEETTLTALAADPHAGAPHHHAPDGELWPPDHPYTGRRWAMVVDLAACTGCSACVVACQVENNVPVVGADEVRRRRIMHWLRLDRYYAGEGDEVDVAHQPMLCQQCENAPCETVCPVLATVHSEEGLNQQVYNRCVGTRYCANNCPYKVRRFNWFNYPREDRLANLVLNPDVTVRSRGVMEKCTFCVQRIQEAKSEARRAGSPVADGAVRTACQQTCPARAITFGDLNDPNSRVAVAWASPRRYRVLEEINVKPSVGYLRLVRNRPGGGGEERHG